MKKFDLKKAQELGEKIRVAEDVQRSYLAHHFPKGYRCDVLLNARQKNPTPATIWGAGSSRYGGGEVCVELDNAKQRSRFRFRHLAPQQVLNVRPAEGDAT